MKFNDVADQLSNYEFNFQNCIIVNVFVDGIFWLFFNYSCYIKIEFGY